MKSDRSTRILSSLLGVFATLRESTFLRSLILVALACATARADTPENLRDENLVAWCIVPFDAKERGPAERAEMVKQLGLRRVAYDWREKHVPTFEEEIVQYQRHGIEMFAFWGAHEQAFGLFEKYGLHPQIWQTLGSPDAASQTERIKAAVAPLLPLVERTRRLGSQLGLYNHGGWGGEPANLVAVCQYLREHHDAAHVGIVYNLHHAHQHIDDFAESLALMKPYLLCLNLNGMTRAGDQRGEKILPLGVGEFDVKLLAIVRDSGYAGPVGIIGHTQDDVALRLRDNLDGLHWILPQLDGKPPGPRPKLRTWSGEAEEEKTKEVRPLRKSSGARRDPPTLGGSEYSPQLVAKWVEEARESGDAHRGLLQFSSAKMACLSCHKIGPHGGSVGPELTAIAKERTAEELVEAVLWPNRQVKPEYIAHRVIDAQGRSHQGYVVRRDEQQLVLRDPTQSGSAEITLALEEIEAEREIGTLMPENLTAAVTDEQLADLLQFVLGLGSDAGMEAKERDMLLMHASAHAHGPVSFPFDRRPLHPEHWPSWQEHVNRDRVYDFYSKQADYFRELAAAEPPRSKNRKHEDQENPRSGERSYEGRPVRSKNRKHDGREEPRSGRSTLLGADERRYGARLLGEFPGLDGGGFGHWGNQDEASWAGDRWNQTELGSMQCGVFRGIGATVARGVCVQLAGDGGLAACFNPDTLAYDAIWTGGFLRFSSVRNGFVDGLRIAANCRPAAPRRLDADPRLKGQPHVYRGYYRHGDRVVFAYDVGGTRWLDAPGEKEGRLSRVVAPADEHPLRHLLDDAPAQWPTEIEKPIAFGEGRPYAVDTIGLPLENPYKALLFCGGHAFLPDGSAVVCTMQGDVWQVSGFEYPSRTAKWRRFASGLHHALGIVADRDGIFVLGRNQITRLHDLNHDGEADFYECFSKAYQTSSAGHDFVCGLERDRDGNFYTASGNQGLVRVAADGRKAEVLATGFRNPDGLGLLPDGTLTVPCSEGDWSPASMICAVRPQRGAASIPHFGYGGPREGRDLELPLVYLPRGLDNSSGGQAYVSSDRWGPLAGQLLHFSFGTGSHFVVLRDEVDGQLQGAVVPLVGEFRSGAHRGRFHPGDGQLYVSGMQGWGTYTPDDGCFHRVRYTGDPVQLPTGFHVHENGVAVTFAAPLDVTTASEPGKHFAQCWNYRYGPGYGSAEFSARHAGMRGHDRLEIAAAHVLPDGRTLFVELPDIQPVNQLHLRLQSSPGELHDLFVTVHKLDEPFTSLPGYRPVAKVIQPHPILADLAMATRGVPNPHGKEIKDARRVTLETGSNLSYKTRVLRVRAGEPIALTLTNPDVVPHNWALVRPGTLDRVGDLANRLISDPEAALRHYVPETPDVLAYTDVVFPREQSTIYFHAPRQPGRYPYLCTFPGHWKVMNGEMVVQP